jgi:hypothetical protein
MFFLTLIELPSSELNPKPEIHILGAMQYKTRLPGASRSIARAIQALAASDDTKEEYKR